MTAESPTDPSALIPPPAVLRANLAKAMRDVEVLRGLLRLSETAARRDGRAAEPAQALAGEGVARG